MPEVPVTYGRLDEALRSLGFTVRGLEARARIYKHEATGATVILPDTPLEEAVLPYHLVVVRTVLKEYDIVDPTDFTSALQKAS
jgi:hypothetical protein